MLFPDTDYTNDMYYLIMELSYNIKHIKKLNESKANELISYTIDLLNILQQYLDDLYLDY